MPMMADLDDPPRSRARGILLGVAIALPLTMVVAGTGLPRLWHVIVGSAKELDARFEVEAGYLNTVCTEAVVLERDESMCKCVLASELPSIDCRPVINDWMLTRQVETCALDGAEEAALSFCTCVNTVNELVADVDPLQDVDGSQRRELTARFEKCAELDDVLALPDPVALTPVSRGADGRVRDRRLVEREPLVGDVKQRRVATETPHEKPRGRPRRRILNDP